MHVARNDQETKLPILVMDAWRGSCFVRLELVIITDSVLRIVIGHLQLLIVCHRQGLLMSCWPRTRICSSHAGMVRIEGLFSKTDCRRKCYAKLCKARAIPSMLREVIESHLDIWCE